MPSAAEQSLTRTKRIWALLWPLSVVAVWAAIVSPFFLAVWFVSVYAVNVPVYDQWHCVALLKSLKEGNISWLGIFLTPNNKHMMGLPLVWMAALAPLTGYDIRMEALLGMAILPVAFAALAQMARQRLPGGILAVLGLVPIAWLVFSLRQNESFLGGMLGAFEHAAVTAFFALTILLLDRVKSVSWPLFIAMLTGTCCAFTLFAGLLVLPLGAVMLVANALASKHTHRASEWLPVALWCIFSAAIGWINFVHNHGLRPRLGDYVSHSAQAPFAYFVTLLGSPLSELGAGSAAFAVGIALLVIFAVFV